MTQAATVDQIRDLLGSAHIFSSIVDELMAEQLRNLGADALTFSQVQLLQFVDRTRAQTISAVAKFLGVSNAAASKAVDRLVRRGLMARTEAPHDRRAAHLSLTDEGRRVLNEFREARNRALERLFAGYSPQDLRSAADLLDHLSATIALKDKEREGICFRCGIYFRDRCLLQERDSRVCFFHRQRRSGTPPGGGDS